MTNHEPMPVRPRTDPDFAALIVDSASDFAILSIDAQGTITSWSTGAERLMGWTAEEAIGQNTGIIFTPADREAGVHLDEMRRTCGEGRSVNERWHLRKDGSRFWGSGLLMRLDPQADGSMGFVKIMRDRTVEREADSRYQALTDALPGFVFVTDADGHNAQVNALFRDYTGQEAEQLLGDRWLETVHGDDRADAQEAWRHAVESGAPYTARLRFRRADGQYRYFDCRAVPQLDEKNRVVRWIGACLDVEDREQARRAVDLLNRNLEQAVSERTAELVAETAERQKVEEALRQSQKMEAIGQLTGGVAHDFNNLLTVITSSVGFLRRQDLSEERRRRYVDAIAETAERAAQLTRQLLAFARRQALMPEVFDVGQRVRGLEDMLRTVVGGRIEVVTELLAEACPVEADPHQFDTALINMALNARDAMDGEGRLVIAVRAADRVPAVRGHAAVSGAFVAVSLADTGEGIPPEILPRVFEPFFTTKEVGKGTGLGLSQVFGFAKQSGGDVAVESAPGQGTTFTLFLPSAQVGEPEAMPRPSRAIEPLRGEGCVLVVEDNQMVGEFAAHLLEDLGFRSVWASSAKEALDRFGEAPDRFNAVFTDVVMPGMSGLDLAQEIRRLNPAMPIVLTSGYSHVLAEQGTHGFELLHKPYSVESLSQALRRARVAE